jgi:hypothetical protein
MEAPVVTIKIKGLGAVKAFNAKGAMLGGVKLKGLAAKGAVVKATEFEAKRITATKGGLLLHVSEMEGHVHNLAPAALGKTGAVAKGVGAKSAVASKSVVSTGAALSAKGLGWSLGLGGLGPWLVLGAVGLAATGVYMYLRAQQEEDALREADEFESPA